MNPDVERFEMNIAIKPEDIDQLGHVNNVVYLRWVQDLAVAHWQAVALEEDQARLVWVVIRHEIDYKRPAFLEDEIVGRTWVGKSTRRTFDRHTEFVRVSDQRVLARVRTVWCPVDRQTGKLTSVSSTVREQFSAPE